MSLIEFITQFVDLDPFTRGIALFLIFVVFVDFYHILFNAVFALFKR